jgi:flagellar hook-associated protein 2
VTTTGADLSNVQIGQSTSSAGLISIPGIASGLNTAAIVSEIMSLDSQPMVQLELEESGVEEKSTQLGNVQSALQTVSTDAQNLSGPGLFDTTEAVNSSDPTTITATAVTGAAVGGYQVAVTALATSAQRSYNFTSPSSADTMTIDGQSITIAAGATMNDVINQINGSSNLDVYAASTGSGTLVLSNRTTGDTGSGFIAVSDPGAALSEIGSGIEGQNAAFSVNGVNGSSESNTVENAIPGVTLTLGGVTSTSSPVTVTVSPPAADTSSIEAAINTFVSDYNTAVNGIETQLTQTPVSFAQNSTDAEQGSLYSDPDLTDLLNNMRQMMYAPGSGLPTGMAALSDIGVSTGAPTGDAAPTASSLAGDLTVDSATLANAIETNPSGVQAVLASFSQSFQALVNTESSPGGVIAQRISDNADETTEMSMQITTMQNALAAQQTQLQDEFTNLETNISQSQSQESQLLSEIGQLPSTTTSG